MVKAASGAAESTVSGAGGASGAATAVPLVHGPENLGVLAVYTTGYSVLSEHHLRVLNIVAEHASAAIQNTRRVEQHRCLRPLRLPRLARSYVFELRHWFSLCPLTIVLLF